MTKTAYITILYIHAVISLSCAKKPLGTRTGNYEKKYWNGPDGECEAPKSKQYVADGCSVGWKKHSSNNFGPQNSENRSGCRYYQRTVLFTCPNSKTAEDTIICWKAVTTYLIRPTCAGVWLNWGECDAPCGAGKKTRVKFVLSDGKGYQQILEHRPCKIRSCGQWSEWSDERVCKNDTCTKRFERNCVYNNSVAPVEFCSGRIAQDNATAEVFEMPCSRMECIDTTTITTSFTTQEETSTVVTQTSSQSTTNDDETGIATTIQPQIVTNASDSNMTNTRDLLSTTVIPTTTTNETLTVLMQNQNPPSTIDIWKGLLIGIFATSLMYGLIGLFIYHRRNSFQNRKKRNDYAYYDHAKTKRGSTAVQNGSNPENLHNPLLPASARTETLTRYEQQPGSTKDTLPQPSTMIHCNQLCNDNEAEPLYSNIPAFEGPAPQLPCNTNADYRDSMADSEYEEQRPDMFDGDCESLDSEEMRDVLRTLKRPSSIFKKKASSLKESSLSLLRSEFERDNNNVNKDRRSTIGSKGSREAPKVFSWTRPSPFSGRVSLQKLISTTQQPATSNDSMMSINMETATSGYNSSIADESTDDEYGGRISIQVSQTRRQSRIRKSANYLRRKLSMSQTKVIPNPMTGGDVSDSNRMPSRIQKETTPAEITRSNFPTCDARPFLTMKPVREHGFSVLSRNDRFVIVEDEYSLPIDAITQVRPTSPSIGYNVPIDALCKYADPT